MDTPQMPPATSPAPIPPAGGPTPPPLPTADAHTPVVPPSAVPEPKSMDVHAPAVPAVPTPAPMPVPPTPAEHAIPTAPEGPKPSIIPPIIPPVTPIPSPVTPMPAGHQVAPITQAPVHNIPMMPSSDLKATEDTHVPMDNMDVPAPDTKDVAMPPMGGALVVPPPIETKPDNAPIEPPAEPIKHDEKMPDNIPPLASAPQEGTPVPIGVHNSVPSSLMPPAQGEVTPATLPEATVQTAPNVVPPMPAHSPVTPGEHQPEHKISPVVWIAVAIIVLTGVAIAMAAFCVGPSIPFLSDMFGCSNVTLETELDQGLLPVEATIEDTTTETPATTQ